MTETYDLNCVVIILYDNNQKILLQHRTSDAPILPDYWAFFGGGIQNNETPIEAVKRETLEEVNYKLKYPILYKETEFIIDDKKGYMYIFLEKLLAPKDSLKLNEGQNWGWFSENEIDALKMIDFDRKLLKEIFSWLKEKK